MAFLDEGTPRWEKCIAGSDSTASIVIGTATPRYSLVVGSKAEAADEMVTVKLTNVATQVPYGVVDQDGADPSVELNPYTLASARKVRIKRSKKLRVRASAAFAPAMLGQGIKPTTTPGVAAAADGGFGSIVGGETIDGVHYLDIFVDEGDLTKPA